MKPSSTPSWRNPSFSHVYVEKDAATAPVAGRILAKLRDAVVIPIDSYKHVFNRKKQSFDAQKKSPKLILAVKRPPFLYPISDRCQSFGEAEVWYATPAVGCPFDCRYCFLRGMYSSGDIVVFVNTADVFDEIRRRIRTADDKLSSITVHISYESDLLALEKLTGLIADWMEFTRKTPELTVELRTKSAAYSRVKHLSSCDRFIIAWSLSPDAVSKKFEPGTPRLRARLAAARRAAADGRTVRLCIDPILPIENGSAAYREMVDNIFTAIPAAAVRDVSVGPFRLVADHIRKMRKSQPEIEILWERALLDTTLLEEIARAVGAYVGRNKVVSWPLPS